MTSAAVVKARLEKVRKAAQSVVQGALRKGAGVIVKEMRKRAPVGPETKKRREEGPKKRIKRRIKVAKSRLRKGEIAAALAKSAAPHSHLVEKGTQQRKRKKGGSTGAVPAKPFAQPAVDATRGAVEQAVAAELTKKLEAMARKIATGG
ncbi:MAG TPA: HK97-gp10 family putative phage morphogenesis protein [Pirellulales bacterium]